MREMAFVMSASSVGPGDCRGHRRLHYDNGKKEGGRERERERVEEEKKKGTRENEGVAGGFGTLPRVIPQPPGENDCVAPRFVMGVGQSVLNPFSFIRHNGGNQGGKEGGKTSNQG